MNCFEYGEGKKEILFLVHDLATDRIKETYINFMTNITENSVIVCKLTKEEVKLSADLKEQFIEEEIKPLVNQYQIKYLITTEGDWFKKLTKQKKVDIFLGYELPSPYLDAKVMYIPSYFRVFYSPDVQDKINFVINKLNTLFTGSYQKPGENIIKTERYIIDSEPEKIKYFFDSLMEYDALTCDIETYSLKHNTSGITSIAFAWNEHEGCAIKIDDSKEEQNLLKREVLKKFFEQYSGKLIFHNIAFDAYILIYQLFMKDQLDVEGLLYGLEVMLKNWDDTKLIAYLATNSCARISCGLKSLAQEYAGNYAIEEIEDASFIPIGKLLKYNLIDCLSTWYVYNKYYSKMINDQQEDIYENVFKPATKDIIQMQLTGLPLNLKKVAEVKKVLEQDKEEALQKIRSSKIIQQFENIYKQNLLRERQAKLKRKQLILDDIKETFNPMSSTQVADLLYDHLGLPVLAKTDKGRPAVNVETLSSLLNMDIAPEIKDVLNGLLELSRVEKILSAFIPAFEKAIPGSNGWNYLCGNFNLGGTVSGRLSSNNPNLQNLPSTGTKYAKLIKSCFEAPKGKIFIGLDFASLEDRISALTTKDPNKLKVYTDQYDGHSLRAFSYFGDQMPDIQKEYQEAESEPEKVKVINSIKSRYKELRQASKMYTFALTYAGTWRTLMEKGKISEEKARHIEEKYHELYEESDKWVAEKLSQASKNGYITAAFGLRVRTPMLAQVIKGNRVTPKEAEAESRTAGNALGQSWCLLNSRAASEFMNQVRNHPTYKYRIAPCAQIHDAQYYLIDDDLELLLWVNETLVKCIQWQDHPDIWHDEVKLEGNLSLFYPDWAHEIELPNHCTKKQFINLIQKKDN